MAFDWLYSVDVRDGAIKTNWSFFFVLARFWNLNLSGARSITRRPIDQFVSVCVCVLSDGADT